MAASQEICMYIYIYIISIYIYIYLYLYLFTWIHSNVFLYFTISKSPCECLVEPIPCPTYSCLIHTSSRFRINFKSTIQKKVQWESSTTKIYYSASLFTAHISSNLIMNHVCAICIYKWVSFIFNKEKVYRYTIYLGESIPYTNGPKPKGLEANPILRVGWHPEMGLVRPVSGPISIVINGGTWGALEMAERNNEVTRVITPTFISGRGLPL